MSVVAQYRGNTSPGQLVDSSGNGYNLTVSGAAVGNPTTPTPPEGDRWLAHVADHVSESYLVGPGAVNSAIASSGSVEFTVLPITNGINANVVFSLDDSSGLGMAGDRLFFVIDPTGFPTHYRVYLFQVSPVFVMIDVPGNVADGLAHTFKAAWGSFGMEVYKDAVLVGSSAIQPTIPTTRFSLAGWSFNVTDDNLAESYLDNVIFESTSPAPTGSVFQTSLRRRRR